MNTLLLLAQAEAAAPANPQAGLGGFVPLILVFAIFYFLLIRPQQRREKERKQQIATLRAGTRVLFCGGMIGTVEEVRDQTFLVKLYDGTVTEIARGAIERLLPDSGSPESTK